MYEWLHSLQRTPEWEGMQKCAGKGLSTRPYKQDLCTSYIWKSDLELIKFAWSLMHSCVFPAP